MTRLFRGALGEALAPFLTKHCITTVERAHTPFHLAYHGHPVIGAFAHVPTGRINCQGNDITRPATRVSKRRLHADKPVMLDYVAIPHVYPQPVELLQLRTVERAFFYRTVHECRADYLVIDDFTGAMAALDEIADLGIVKGKPTAYFTVANTMRELREGQRRATGHLFDDRIEPFGGFGGYGEDYSLLLDWAATYFTL